MAKSNNGGAAKGAGAETKARRAPVRRSTSEKSTDTPVASAPDLGQAKTTARRRSVASTATPDQAPIGAHSAPSPEEVQCRAYELFVRRGGSPGGHLDDWYEAERELRSQAH